MAVESDAEFLARLRPPFITRADRARLAQMMADEARALGDVEAAERLAGNEKGPLPKQGA